MKWKMSDRSMFAVLLRSRCFLWSWHSHANYFSRAVMDPKQETRARR
jgi:hypothetical protein